MALSSCAKQSVQNFGPSDEVCVLYLTEIKQEFTSDLTHLKTILISGMTSQSRKIIKVLYQ